MKSAGLAVVAGAAGSLMPTSFLRAAYGSEFAGKILIVIFQRGAVDGLSMVIPHFEPEYESLRPNIAIGRPGARAGSIDLDGRFGLHPALAPLHPHWKSGSLAFIHAAGSPHPTRSHFDAQELMETGTVAGRGRDGFLTRAIESSPASATLRAVSMTSKLPSILSGRSDAIAVKRFDRFSVRDRRTTEAAEAFEALYGATPESSVRQTAQDSFEAARILETVSKETPRNGATYPRGELGESLRQLAALIRADVGLEIGFAESGGWDTHAQQGAEDGQLARRLGDWGGAIDAFVTDLGSRMQDVVLVSVSEFGRTVAENGNRGTDHGHGNVITVVGGEISGGQVLGEWPGLGRSQRFEGRDLAVTTDYRDVLGELLSRVRRDVDLGHVFPGHHIDRSRWPGLCA